MLFFIHCHRAHFLALLTYPNHMEDNIRRFIYTQTQHIIVIIWHRTIREATVMTFYPGGFRSYGHRQAVPDLHAAPPSSPGLLGGHRETVRDCLAATARQSGTISLVVTDFLASDWSSRQSQLTTD